MESDCFPFGGQECWDIHNSKIISLLHSLWPKTSSAVKTSETTFCALSQPKTVAGLLRIQNKQTGRFIHDGYPASEPLTLLYMLHSSLPRNSPANGTGLCVCTEFSIREVSFT